LTAGAGKGRERLVWCTRTVVGEFEEKGGLEGIGEKNVTVGVLPGGGDTPEERVFEEGAIPSLFWGRERE